ncbi:MAG: transporter substrate-binding domain-containing protein [Campylobacterota bacterium]|nr:transporter substrate-binding domain-containing protein [Campylobacterota bacterium]
MTKLLQIIVIFFTLNLSANQDIFTSIEKDWINNNTIKVGVEQWEPVVHMNKNNTIDGISGDILKLIIKKTDLKVEYVSDEWSNLLNNFKNNNIDLLPATYYTNERAKYGLYTKSYFKMKEYIYVKSSNNSIKSFDDLTYKKIAIIKDYGTIPKIKKAYPTIEIIETNNMEESINFVLDGKVDAYIDAQIGVVDFLNKNIVVGIKGISQTSFEASPLHFFLNIKKPILQSILDKSLSLISSEEKSQIVFKWLNSTNDVKNKLSHLTQDEILYLRSNNTIKMCNNPNWTPIEFVDDNKPKGIAIDVINELSKMLNVTFQHVPTDSWSQSQQYLKEKKCDILPAATPTKKRKEYASFTDTYLEYKLAIITQNDKPFANNIESIISKPMSRKKGSGLINKLKKEYPTINIVETTGYEESLKKVSSGDVYYTIATIPVASHYISKFGLYNLHIAGYIDNQFNLSIACRDDYKILKDILNKSLKELPKNYVKKIETNWSNVHITQKNAINYKYLLEVVIVLLIIGVFLVYRQHQAKLHHEEIELQNQKFEKMLNSTMEGISLIENGIIIDINKAGLELYGIKDKNEIVGLKAFDMIADESLDLAIQKASLSEYDPYELFLLRYDGSKYPALMQASEYKTKDSNIRIITVIDLTVVKEKEKLLSHSGKMAQMGEMIGNIAHQWRQPLSVITTAATGVQVKKEYNILTDKELNSYLESIITNANHLSDTIDIFRNFIKEKVELKGVVIQDRIDNALGIIKTRLASKHVELINRINYEDKLRVVIVVGELSQVIINIINNAIDVLVEKDIVNKWIKIDLIKNEKTVLLTIEDNAGGIPEDILPKIFEPYFTTKHQSVGTGIGLYMSYDIIVNHMHGNLYAKNTKNGAKFFLEIPMEQRESNRRETQGIFSPPDKRENDRRKPNYNILRD